MKHVLLWGVIALSFFSCQKEDEPTNEQMAKEYVSNGFNYPIFIDITRDGFRFISISTEQVYCSDYKENTYIGSAKGLLNEKRIEDAITLDLVRGKSLPTNDRIECKVYFADTCIVKTMDEADNTLIIR